MYSASIVLSETLVCFLLSHESTPDPKLKQHPEMLFLSSTLPTQSESVQPHNLNSLSAVYLSPQYQNLNAIQIFKQIVLIMFAAKECIMKIETKKNKPHRKQRSIAWELTVSSTIINPMSQSFTSEKNLNQLGIIQIYPHGSECI